MFNKIQTSEREMPSIYEIDTPTNRNAFTTYYYTERFINIYSFLMELKEKPLVLYFLRLSISLMILRGFNSSNTIIFYYFFQSTEG